MRLLLHSQRRATPVSPTKAKLCCVEGAHVQSQTRTAVSEAAGGVHGPHSVLHY